MALNEFSSAKWVPSGKDTHDPVQSDRNPSGAVLGERDAEDPSRWPHQHGTQKEKVPQNGDGSKTRVFWIPCQGVCFWAASQAKFPLPAEPRDAAFYLCAKADLRREHLGLRAV